MILIRSIIFIIISLLCSFVLEAQTIFKCCDGNNICYKNSLGKTIVRSKKYTIAFSDSISSIGFVGTRKGKVVCIINHGKELFEVYNVDNGPDYVSDGLFRIVGKDDKVGFADTCGAVVIPPVFSYANPFLNGVSLPLLCEHQVTRFILFNCFATLQMKDIMQNFYWSQRMVNQLKI